MPAQVVYTVENNFTKGLITEATGMNFPENAATDSDNVEYTLIGDVVRRLGIDVEVNGVATSINTSEQAVSTFKWDNAGGDGLTQVIVVQIGGTLYFYRSSSASSGSPISQQQLSSTINLTLFSTVGNLLDLSQECQYASGNGYLFVFNPQCDPFYCTYSAGTITASGINFKVRDFGGIFESLPVNVRPSTLSAEHQYNLINQGWTKGNPWQATSALSVTAGTGSKVFSVAASLSIANGDIVSITNAQNAFPGGIFQAAGTLIMSGTVTSYVGTTLTINVTYVNPLWNNTAYSPWVIFPNNYGFISSWFTAEGNYPSNADVWWHFKNSSGAFDPTTQGNVDLSTGNAPKGSILLNPFNQTRTAASGITGLTDVTTTSRPKTGCWFQGRVWYTGVDNTFPATGDAIYTTWTENIYFSQVVQTSADFGKCYQTNDPTAEVLSTLLPSDGGVIQIQGAGSIYKLFPLMNALLVFASNGVWYLSGSQGIGFAANDYSVVKLSAVRSISSFSFVDINGLPIFWNEEGIYQVEPAKQGQGLLNSPLHVNPLEVNAITVGTIRSFFEDIPKTSKTYARGSYDPINYVVQWVYKDTEAVDTTDRYRFNKILNYNTANKAFFPYTVDKSNVAISSIVYVSSPGGESSIDSEIKYIASNGSDIYFADEHDTSYQDWVTGNGTGVDYTSTFTTGYKVHGQGEKRFQIPYIYIYSRLNNLPTSYYIQGLWDYALSADSGRWSVKQYTNVNNLNYGVIQKRHRIRGRGLALQIKVTSVSGQPFDIIGWAVFETQNASV